MNAEQRPALLLVGSGYGTAARAWREHLLGSAHRRCRLHLLSHQPPTWERPFIDGFDIVNPLDVPAMVRLANAAATPYDGVLCYQEMRLTAAAELATALGVRTSPRAAVQACRDKYAGRELLRAAGVPTARSVAVASAAAAHAAADEIGYPVVMKPRALSASIGVTLVTRADDIDAAYEEAIRIQFDGIEHHERPVLVEEYLDGPEISVDALCRDGRVTPVFVARKELGYAPGFEEIGHVVHADDPLRQDPALCSMLQSTHTAIGLTNTVTHSEFRLTAAGPRLVEINARPGGGGIPYLGWLATGIELGAVVADLAAGREPDLAMSRCRIAAIRFLYPDYDMDVATLMIDPAWAEGDIKIRLMAAPGSQLLLPPAAHVSGRYAALIAVADSESACGAALDEAAAAVTISGTPLTRSEISS